MYPEPIHGLSRRFEQFLESWVREIRAHDPRLLRDAHDLALALASEEFFTGDDPVDASILRDHVRPVLVFDTSLARRFDELWSLHLADGQDIRGNAEPSARSAELPVSRQRPGRRNWFPQIALGLFGVGMLTALGFLILGQDRADEAMPVVPPPSPTAQSLESVPPRAIPASVETVIDPFLDTGPPYSDDYSLKWDAQPGESPFVQAGWRRWQHGLDLSGWACLAGSISLLVAAFSVWWARSRVWSEARYLMRQLRPRSDGESSSQLWLGLQRGALDLRSFVSGVASRFRQYRLVAASRLDGPATIRASIRRGGFFTPIRAERPETPEYLFLLEERHDQDHLGRLAQSWSRALQSMGVEVAEYRFHGTPERAFAAPSVGEEADPASKVRLRDLAVRFPGRRLVVFGQNLEAVDPYSDRPEDWFVLLDQWEGARALVTPTGAYGGYQTDRWREEGWKVFDFSESGLRSLGGWFAGEGSHSLPAGELLPPPELIFAEDAWIGPAPIETRRIDRLMEELSVWLGSEGLLLLQACAVFPVIDWHLTRYLHHALCTGRDFAGATPDSEGTLLLKLSQLPWMREGRMPEWLREKLGMGLSKVDYEIITALVGKTLLDGLDGGSDYQIKISAKSPRKLRRLAKSLWHRLARRYPELEDELVIGGLAGFRGRRRTWFRLPAGLKKSVHHAWPVALLALGAGALLWLSGEVRARTSVPTQPRVFALLVAAGTYETADLRKLAGPPNDIELMRGTLIEHFDVDPGDIVTIEGAQATREAFVAAFQSGKIGRAKPEDRVLIYFSGNGTQIPGSESDQTMGALVFFDTEPTAPETMISESEFSQFLDGIAAQRGMVILDACNSGEFGYRREGWAVWAACGENEIATEGTVGSGERTHGRFTWALAEAFTKAPDQSLSEANAWIRSQMEASQRNLAGEASTSLLMGIGQEAKLSARDFFRAPLSRHYPIIERDSRGREWVWVPPGTFASPGAQQGWDRVRMDQGFWMARHSDQEETLKMALKRGWGLSTATREEWGQAYHSGRAEGGSALIGLNLPKEMPGSWPVVVRLFPEEQLLDMLAMVDGANIRLCEPMAQTELATLEGDGGDVLSVAFAPDSMQVASGSADASVKLWNLATGEEIFTLSGHRDVVTSMAFSPDGTLLASGSRDNTVKVWAVATEREVATLKGHSDLVTSVAFSPDGAQLASGSGDTTVKLWETSSWREMASLSGHSGQVTSVAFSPDGSRIASGSGDRTVKLWDVATGRETATLKGHSDLVTSVAFSPDGAQLASGSGDTTVKLWETISWKEITSLSGHSGQVTSVAFSPDGTRLASGSLDPMVKLWEVATGKELAQFWARGASGGPVALGVLRGDSSLFEAHYELARFGQRTSSIRDFVSRPGVTRRVDLSENPAVSLEMVWCPPTGPEGFQMGSPESEPNRDSDETLHTVVLTSGFWLGKTEVTQGGWEAVMGEKPTRFKGESRPVESLSWDEAMEFCRRLTDRERARGALEAGWEYTLPTEAQWEYACRSGTKTSWSFGDDEKQMHRYGNFNGDIQDDGIDSTVPVETYLPNPWGFFDMHGNVWEWCLDAKHSLAADYPRDTITDPYAERGSNRVARGGGFNSSPADCRSAIRNASQRADRSSALGLRLALVPAGQPVPLAARGGGHSSER